jgi:hypothetical protein
MKVYLLPSWLDLPIADSVSVLVATHVGGLLRQCTRVYLPHISTCDTPVFTWFTCPPHTPCEPRPFLH